ncbi:hypothetical protein EYF80_043438 [Liparis tanakae]|uniref:Uncharacterized protein n=1 Tax=Liparis tanakae TaxID=230148 RepID=A0A4Z2FZN5_9TELE|nr:hypothetical protein EYF80_043438 [Liparis tanakae]
MRTVTEASPGGMLPPVSVASTGFVVQHSEDRQLSRQRVDAEQPSDPRLRAPRSDSIREVGDEVGVYRLRRKTGVTLYVCWVNTGLLSSTSRTLTDSVNLDRRGSTALSQASTIRK